jgi:hypothetical protein
LFNEDGKKIIPLIEVKRYILERISAFESSFSSNL